ESFFNGPSKPKMPKKLRATVDKLESELEQKREIMRRGFYVGCTGNGRCEIGKLLVSTKPFGKCNIFLVYAVLPLSCFTFFSADMVAAPGLKSSSLIIL